MREDAGDLATRSAMEHNAHENEHRLTLEEATKEFGTTSSEQSAMRV